MGTRSLIGHSKCKYIMSKMAEADTTNVTEALSEKPFCLHHHKRSSQRTTKTIMHDINRDSYGHDCTYRQFWVAAIAP